MKQVTITKENSARRGLRYRRWQYVSLISRRIRSRVFVNDGSPAITIIRRGISRTAAGKQTSTKRGARGLPDIKQLPWPLLLIAIALIRFLGGRSSVADSAEPIINYIAAQYKYNATSS